MTHPIILKIKKEYTDYYHAYWELKKEHPDKNPNQLNNITREKYLHNESADILNDLESLRSALSDYYYYMFLYAKEQGYEIDYSEDGVAKKISDEEQKVLDDRQMVTRLAQSVGFGNEPTLHPSEIYFNLDDDLDIHHSNHVAYKVVLKPEGFPVTLYGLSLQDIGEEISFAKAIFKDFVSRATRHMPDLLKHKVPIKLAYGKENHAAEVYGTYIISGQTIVLNMRNLLEEVKRNKDRYVKVLAHEMAHHYYFTVLNSRQRNFWVQAIKADYTSGSIYNFLDDMKDEETLGRYIDRIKKIDPLKYLQMSSIVNVEDIEHQKKSDFLARSKNYWVTFSKNPVSVYGSTRPEEAFAEVIGYILGFGSNSILPLLLERMKVVIPTIKIAKEKPMLNRIASLERRLASLEHILSLKTAGSHVKLPPRELAELTHISDKALDHAYHYGLSKPGTFGYKANEQSVLHAIDVIATGNTNIEAIADAVHKGWSHAFFTVKDPAYKDPTVVDEASGLTKGQKKYNSRLALAKTSYRSLSNDEKEKDRVVARAVLEWAEENGWVGGLLP